jgi:hypothetical protein
LFSFCCRKFPDLASHCWGCRQQRRSDLAFCYYGRSMAWQY